MTTSRNRDQAAAEKASDQVQATMDEATDAGVFGTKVDPIPDAEYTLTTGPNSPSAFPDHTTRAAQHSLGADRSK